MCISLVWHADRRDTHTRRMYKEDGLKGGHVIMLGPGCEEAALAALQAYPHGLQIGGKCLKARDSFWWLFVLCVIDFMFVVAYPYLRWMLSGGAWRAFNGSCIRPLSPKRLALALGQAGSRRRPRGSIWRRAPATSSSPPISSRGPRCVLYVCMDVDLARGSSTDSMHMSIC